MRSTHLALVCLLAAFALAGCDSLKDKLNDAMPEIAVADGVFGLNGENGVEATGTFSAAGKSSGIEATATLSVVRSFDDLEAGDLGEISELNTRIGLISNESGSMQLTRTTAASLPNSISVTGWSLDWTVTDDAGGSLGTPSGSPLFSNTAVTFFRQPGCAATAPSCGYLPPSAGVAETLVSLFPLSIVDEAYLAALADVVFAADQEANSRNTVSLQLTVTVSNPASEVTGISVSARVGEYQATVTPLIF